MTDSYLIVVLPSLFLIWIAFFCLIVRLFQGADYD